MEGIKLFKFGSRMTLAGAKNWICSGRRVDVYIKSKLFCALQSCLYSRNHEPERGMRIKHLEETETIWDFFLAFSGFFPLPPAMSSSEDGEKREMNNNFVDRKLFLITRATRFARASQGFAFDNWIFSLARRWLDGFEMLMILICLWININALISAFAESDNFFPSFLFAGVDLA